MTEQNRPPEPPYVGVDVGGTKILAALVTPAGRILARHKLATPRDVEPAGVVEAIGEAVEAVAAAGGAPLPAVAGVGLSIPGVCDADAGRIVITPNMNLTGVEIVPPMQDRLGIPVTLGNDVNCGTLGEKWLGTGRDAESLVGIFVGTGIGGGVFLNGRILRGAREAAGEIGHLVMEMGGPKCGCGARGCFEAIASRTAMEREIRKAIAAGRKTVVTDLLDGKRDVIRSGILRRALARKDKVVVGVLHRAAKVMGHACLSIRHLVDPEVIVFGGGVIEACGEFLLPIIEEVVASDPLTGARPGGRVLMSALGDDAVVIGAAALAQQAVGEDPFAAAAAVPDYPAVRRDGDGLTVAGRSVVGPLLLDGDGELVQPVAVAVRNGRPRLGARVVSAALRGCPKALFVDGAEAGSVRLSKRARLLLHFRGVDAHVGPDAVERFAACPTRKALVVPAAG